MIIDISELYTIKQMSELLNVNRNTIKNYCIRGLIGFRIKHKGLSDSGYLLSKDDVKFLKDRFEKKGEKLT